MSRWSLPLIQAQQAERLEHVFGHLRQIGADRMGEDVAGAIAIDLNPVLAENGAHLVDADRYHQGAAFPDCRKRGGADQSATRGRPAPNS